MLLLLISASHGNPYTPPTIGPSSKVKLQLDPLAYRSASQGPVMPAELEPASKEDYEEIDLVIERATRTYGWSPVIPQYAKSSQWAWQQWEYTIVQRLWKNCMISAILPTCLLLIARYMDPAVSWWSLDKTHRFAAPLLAIEKGWNYLLTLTTFVTTFFVSHSHSFWRKSYSLSRSVQGRLNDIGLLCATHAARNPDGSLTEASEALLLANARNLRLLHCLFYADICYRKPKAGGRHNSLSTASVRLLLAFDREARIAPGLTRLRDRGLLTDEEYETLVNVQLPPSRWYLIVLQWICSRIHSETMRGTLTGGAGFEQVAMGKMCDLRSSCMSIPDELAARMPLAYVHLTHCLVDILLGIAPFGLYPNLGLLSIPMTVLISLFYRGLLELSKVRCVYCIEPQIAYA